MTNGLGAFAVGAPDDFTAMTSDEVDTLREAFGEFGLLVFRGRKITLDEQFALCGSLGKCVDQPGSGRPWFNITTRDGSGAGTLNFHADFTNAPPGALLTGASLCATELPDDPTSTVYAHSGVALAELPSELRERIRGRTAIHSMPSAEADYRVPFRYQLGKTTEPLAEHPIEFVHPVTGRQVLYVSDMNTERVVGLDDAESTELLDELVAWLRRPRFVYRHTWQLHDLVVWDNVVMQHSRDVETVKGTRTLRRVPFTYPAWHAACQAFFDIPDIHASHMGAGEGVNIQATPV